VRNGPACRPCATPPTAPGSSLACWPSPSWWFQLATRPVARPASGAVAFRFETIHTLLYPLSAPCRSPRPFSATLGIDGKRADRQETESVNGPTNPPARDRSLVRGLHSQAYGGAVFLVGGLLLAAMGRLPPGVAGRTG